jgi:hypothetical protein
VWGVRLGQPEVEAAVSRPSAGRAAGGVAASWQFGGLDTLSLGFYQSEEIGNDSVWDVWRLEGPAMPWYFRGGPHVHTWVHTVEKA